MNRPAMIGQPAGHGRRLWLPTGEMGLVKVGLAQGMMASTEVINGAQEKHGCMQSLLMFGRMATAPSQDRQAFAKGCVKPFNVGRIDEQAAMRVKELFGDKRWCPTQDAPRQGKDGRPALPGVFDETGDGERFPNLQLATSAPTMARHLMPEGTQNGLRIGRPAICNHQQGAAGAGTTADTSQHAVGQAAIPTRTDNAAKPEASADHHRHPQPEQDATAFDPNFVCLHMCQCQSPLLNDGLMNLFAVVTSSITPVRHRPLIQAVGLYDSLDWTATRQQCNHDYYQLPVMPQPRKHRPLPGAEAFPAALALIPWPLAPVTHDIPYIALPACFTLRIGAEYALGVLGFSFCHGKQSLHQEHFFFKFPILYHLVE